MSPPTTLVLTGATKLIIFLQLQDLITYICIIDVLIQKIGQCLGDLFL